MFVFAFCQVCSGSSVQCLCGDTSTLWNFPMLTFGDVSHIFTNSQNSLRFKKFLVTRSLGMFLPPEVENEGDKSKGWKWQKPENMKYQVKFNSHMHFSIKHELLIFESVEVLSGQFFAIHFPIYFSCDPNHHFHLSVCWIAANCLKFCKTPNTSRKYKVNNKVLSNYINQHQVWTRQLLLYHLDTLIS